MKNALVVAAVLFALSACGRPGHSSTAEDSGVVQCRNVAKSVTEPGDASVPTDEEISKVRDNYEGSSFSDLKKAGLAYVDAIEAFMAEPGDVTPLELMAKKSALFATCGKHGVVVPAPSVPEFKPVPTISVPAMPTFTPEPYRTMPKD